MGSFIELFFLEHDFVTESGGLMSQLYSIDESKTKYDWGFVENALRRGTDQVTIRPANDAETRWAFKKLAKIKAEASKVTSCASCKTE